MTQTFDFYGDDSFVGADVTTWTLVFALPDVPLDAPEDTPTVTLRERIGLCRLPPVGVLVGLGVDGLVSVVTNFPMISAKAVRLVRSR